MNYDQLDNREQFINDFIAKATTIPRYAAATKDTIRHDAVKFLACLIKYRLQASRNRASILN